MVTISPIRFATWPSARKTPPLSGRTVTAIWSVSRASS